MRRQAFLVLTATLALLGTGCGAGDDTASEPSVEPSETVQQSELDGVQVDVRRDPG